MPSLRTSWQTLRRLRGLRRVRTPPWERLDQYGEREEPEDYAGDGDLDDECPGTVDASFPLAPRRHPAPLRIHLPFPSEGGVRISRVKRALTRRGIRYSLRTSRGTGCWYLYADHPARARAALRELGVFWV